MEGVDIVIHLAARAHVMDDQSSDPLAEYRRINVDGTAAIAEAASDAEVKRLIFLSSIKVNGEQTFEKPYTAADTPAPEDAYGISKAEAEKKLKEISARTRLEAVIIRTPLVYGPGVRANFLSLMSVANSDLPLPFGSITKNQRSLIYIGNLVDILLTATQNPAASRQTMLVRDGAALSTAELVRLLRCSLGKPKRMIAVPPAILHCILSLLGRKAMSGRLLGSLAIDDQATRDTLEWTAPFSVKEGLKRTTDWYLTMKQNS